MVTKRVSKKKVTKRSKRRQRSEWSLLKSKFKKENPVRQCAYCGITPDIAPRVKLQIDHIQPRVLFPHLEYEITNLQWLCSLHNQMKGAKHPYVYTGHVYYSSPLGFPSDSPSS